MTFKPAEHRKAFVWISLPGGRAPVVAGRLDRANEKYFFTYGRSYLDRSNAIPIYTPELPLSHDRIEPVDPMPMANAIRDALPDAWGRRVVATRLVEARGLRLKGDQLEDAIDEIDELTFGLESGSNRFGALDFQASSDQYVERAARPESLETLVNAAERIEKQLPISDDLSNALLRGASIGGARPKAYIEDEHGQYLAKFSSADDDYDVMKAEYVAMRLAGLAGLDVPRVATTRVMGNDILLIERFDRERGENPADGWIKRPVVSGLTVLGLHELFAAYASYEDLADEIRKNFVEPRSTLKEMFSRMTFNILVGNTDDHARNHAAFWDGKRLELTPAYDVCPQRRSGNEASQAMRIYGAERRSQIGLCLKAAHRFQLSEEDGLAIVRKQTEAIVDCFETVCDEAKMGRNSRRQLWRRQFLNDLAFEGIEDRMGPCIERIKAGPAVHRDVPETDCRAPEPIPIPEPGS